MKHCIGVSWEVMGSHICKYKWKNTVKNSWFFMDQLYYHGSSYIIWCYNYMKKLVSQVMLSKTRPDFIYIMVLGFVFNYAQRARMLTANCWGIVWSMVSRATRLLDILPKSVNSIIALEPFKVALGVFMTQIPDKPPVTGYAPPNSNSLLDWSAMGGQGVCAWHRSQMQSLPKPSKSIKKVSIYDWL